jgi:hypothetical protein
MQSPGGSRWYGVLGCNQHANSGTRRGIACFFQILETSLQRTVPTSGDSMFHHVLSSALSTVFDVACAILPAAPLFVVKNLSSSGGPVPELAQKRRSAKAQPPVQRKVLKHSPPHR